MSRWRSIWLVARREIIERGRSRGFIFSVLFTTAIVIGSFLVPPSAPMVVPLRAAFGAIEPWEIIVSIVLTVTAIYGLFAVGGRIYSGAVLQTGGRMKIRDAWRSAGE